MRLVRQALANPLLQVVGARAVTFPVTLVCGLVWLRLVIGQLGAAEYGFLALVVGLQFLLGFLDFGTSANVLEGAGRFRVDRDVAALGRALGSAWRMILVGNLLVLLGAVLVLVAGAWGPILGFPERTATAGLAVVLILAVNTVVRPLSLSSALVAGLGRPAVATWAQSLTGLSSLGLLAVLLWTDAPVAFIAATPIAGQLVAYAVPFVVSMRTVPGLLRAAGAGMLRRTHADHKLRRLALPLLVIQMIGPLNDQLDRLVLAHLSTVEALASYALGAQLYSSAMSFCTVLIPQLWSEFAELRATGGPRAAVRRSLSYLRRLWPLAVLGGAAFTLVCHEAAPWVSDGKLELSWLLCSVFGAELALSASSLVLGIGLTDPRSLRRQPVLLAISTGVNLVLTLVLAGPLGALGPALASLVAASLQLPLLALLAAGVLRDRAADQHDREPDLEAFTTRRAGS
ncbi:Membrane protein involved in the export of O-antigen and teichoic acid [Friedmanniella luteola]|uniref:Membrane protein involved in the export of O-antigen and teichoic acid n=1 Tax=Friedmanniella luteola TaxID=546871 RepID=A0A1H1PZN0_9ACTN|nr:oligosaccharide flippase family protein [Friedmanniella luteola]SDS16672.1 Membrane protein involved in the export of O-antigen and teichoic acid [Friedmanniella luteola]